ncbi:MAG: cytochrome b/b6 domain-containing protein [Pseudomonadota bacterium]
MGRRVALVWDLPSRLFHWALAGCLIGSYASLSAGHPIAHQAMGFMLCALLLFRLLWGVVGSETARFAAFLAGPRRTFYYLRSLGSPRHQARWGHGPVGGLLVLVRLLLLAALVVTGVLAQGGGLTGPWSGSVDGSAAAALLDWHRVAHYGLGLLLVLHLAGVGYYLIRHRTNLLRPIVTGRRSNLDGLAPPLRFASLERAAMCWLAALLATLFVFRLLPLPGIG